MGTFVTAMVSRQRDSRAAAVWLVLAAFTGLGWWIDARGMSQGWPFVVGHQRELSILSMTIAVLSAWSIAAWFYCKFKCAHKEDVEWGRNYGKFLSLGISRCTIHLAEKERTISVEYVVANSYRKSKRVWISSSVAVFGRDQNRPLFILPVPMVESDVGSGARSKLQSRLSATINRADAGIAAAQYAMDNKLAVRLVDAQLTTIADLTTSPRTVTISASSVSCDAEVYT